jgi:hypothetical protein
VSRRLVSVRVRYLKHGWAKLVWPLGLFILTVCVAAKPPRQSTPSPTHEEIIVDKTDSNQKKKKTAEEVEVYRQLYAIATHLQYSDALYPVNTHRSVDDWLGYENNIYFVAQRKGEGKSPAYVPTNAESQLKVDEAVPLTPSRSAKLKSLLNLEIVNLCRIYRTNRSQVEKRIGRYPVLGVCPPVLVAKAPEAFLESRSGEKVTAAIISSPTFIRDLLLATPSMLGIVEKQLRPPKSYDPPESVLEEEREEDEYLARGPRVLTYEYFLMFSALRGPTPLESLPMEDSTFQGEALLSELAFKSLISFVLAHELGHIVLGHHSTSHISCDRFQENELQADAFATIITYDRFTILEKKFVGEETGYADMIASGMDTGAQGFLETVYSLAGFDGPQMGCQYPLPKDRLTASSEMIEKLEDDKREKLRDDAIRKSSKQPSKVR